MRYRIVMEYPNAKPRYWTGRVFGEGSPAWVHDPEGAARFDSQYQSRVAWMVRVAPPMKQVFARVEYIED